MTVIAESHDELRPLMFSIAYRMLGSVAEAEDVVQDALLRMTRAASEGEEPRNLDAWATTVTTRLAIDTLRSARVRRESYVGTWLPEPLVATDAFDPARRIAPCGPAREVDLRNGHAHRSEEQPQHGSAVMAEAAVAGTRI